MSSDSMPDYGDRAPTFEEVVAYAQKNGLYGKVPLSKFYDFYHKQGFMFRGSVMDWKGKLQEWADRQTGPVRENYRENQAKPKDPIDVTQLKKVAEIFGLKGLMPV